MSQRCPTCGMAVHIVSAGEGTNHYEPLVTAEMTRRAVELFRGAPDLPVTTRVELMLEAALKGTEERPPMRANYGQIG